MARKPHCLSLITHLCLILVYSPIIDTNPLTDFLQIPFPLISVHTRPYTALELACSMRTITNDATLLNHPTVGFNDVGSTTVTRILASIRTALCSIPDDRAHPVVLATCVRPIVSNPISYFPLKQNLI